MLVAQSVDPVLADHERLRQAVDLAFEAYVETFVELYLKQRWKQWSALTSERWIGSGQAAQDRGAGQTTARL